MPIIKELTDGKESPKSLKMNSSWPNYKDGNRVKKNMGIIRTKINKPIFTIEENDRFYAFQSKIPKKTEQKLKKKKPATISKLIFSNLDNYFDKSTLHGLRYVGDNSLTLGERIFWLISFLTAIAFAAYFINIIYAKFNNSPVIISFSPTAVSVSEIPFPAVTICSVNVVKKEEGERILRSGQNRYSSPKMIIEDNIPSTYTTSFSKLDTKGLKKSEQFVGVIPKQSNGFFDKLLASMPDFPKKPSK